MTRAPAIIETPAGMRLASERWRSSGMVLGIVPTMGALHDGHLTLIRRARADCDRVVVSIFVNPAQFGPAEDFARYPRPREHDLAVCAAERVDAVYAPAVEAMYPPGFSTALEVTGPLTSTLEGAARPGHLAGVALVVTKLLAASRADRAYFGQKDAQQCAVVTRLAADLDLGTEIVVCPTARDRDGLALSSRNAYLEPEERTQALAIPRGLAAAATLAQAGVLDVSQLAGAVLAELQRSPSLRIEYVAVVDGADFTPVDQVDAGARIQVAARIGSTRLIDTLCPLVDDPPNVPPRAELPAATATAARVGRGQGQLEPKEP
jgi:pantoate--beta-alanine ligase